eukprot:TRINITY_DN2660_c0_g1_i1.p1 TRINITY_DN2660_c0_g1~~TRINITY_DN2660_c0_g1_i1.p1  ORF type:complete len:560 (-),score=32.38 TRINITY_DN2660_c0_g1_i1:365-2044(-)
MGNELSASADSRQVFADILQKYPVILREHQRNVKQQRKSQVGFLERLKNKDEQLASKIEEAQEVAIFVTDVFRKIQWVNDAFESVTGYCLDDAFGRLPEELLQGPMTGIDAAFTIRTSMIRKMPFDLDLVSHRKNGEAYLTNLHIAPMYDADDTVQHFIGLQRCKPDTSLQQSVPNLLLEPTRPRARSHPVALDLDIALRHSEQRTPLAETRAPVRQQRPWSAAPGPTDPARPRRSLSALAPLAVDVDANHEPVSPAKEDVPSGRFALRASQSLSPRNSWTSAPLLPVLQQRAPLAETRAPVRQQRPWSAAPGPTDPARPRRSLSALAPLTVDTDSANPDLASPAKEDVPSGRFALRASQSLSPRNSWTSAPLLPVLPSSTLPAAPTWINSQPSESMSRLPSQVTLSGPARANSAGLPTQITPLASPAVSPRDQAPPVSSTLSLVAETTGRSSLQLPSLRLPARPASASVTASDDRLALRSGFFSKQPQLQPVPDSYDVTELVAELEQLKDDRLCCVCFDAPKNCALGCGHCLCTTCAAPLKACPICRQKKVIMIPLFY